MKAVILATVTLFLASNAAAEQVTDPELLKKLNEGRIQWDSEPSAKWWEEYEIVEPPAPAPEKLGPGPHTLVISAGDALTQMDYTTGEKCQKARDEIRRQLGDGKVHHGPNGGVVFTASGVRTFCVPR